MDLYLVSIPYTPNHHIEDTETGWKVRKDLLLEKCIRILAVMHPAEMLFEIVLSRPHLVGPGAVLSKAKVHHLGPALGFLVVNALLVAGQVVNGSKPFLARTVRFVAFEQLAMPSLMLSTKDIPVSTVSIASRVRIASETHTFYLRDTFPPMCMSDDRT